MPQNFIFYPNNFIFPVFKAKNGDCNIKVLPIDTLSAAALLSNPCCLNFASPKSPGGGYKGTSQAQEEFLFRRTNLPELMDTEECRKHYPLTNLKAIYCPNVQVNKGTNLEDITPFNISVITLPAIINPDFTKDSDLILTQNKMKRILEIAAFHERKNLILGAAGCGVFKADPWLVAEIFLNLLCGDFENIFSNIIFAIISKNKPGDFVVDNFVAFNSIFDKFTGEKDEQEKILQ